MKRTFLLPGVNPEPWAVGSLGYRNIAGKIRPYVGPNLKLQSFQKEVKEELERVMEFVEPSDLIHSLQFFFWRRLDSWEGGSGRKSNAHVADVTNLQKGLEDALQGVLITNDRNVRSIYSEVVEQGADVDPGIMIIMEDHKIKEFTRYVDYEVLIEFDMRRRNINKVQLENEW